MKTIIEQGNKEFHFVFDPETDDPKEGVTLTGIFQDGQRLRPSDFSDSEVPYGDAERKLIK
jgi:hypothetical protein